MKGSNIILLVVITTTIIGIMGASGGIFDLTNYQVSTDNADDEVDKTIEKLDDFDFNVDNPVSGLSEALSMFKTLISLAWNFDTVLIIIGVPSWIAGPIWTIARVILIFTSIGLLLRNGGII